MKAVFQDRYGSADVLQYGETSIPDVGDRKVLISVAAAGVDRGAWHFMTGQPYLMRLMGFGLRAPRVKVPGTNIAGRVVRVGPKVTQFRPGDHVYGRCRGAWAEYAVAREAQLAVMPSPLSFEQASVVPYAAFASWQAVHDHAKVQPGERVLVVGGTGAVGSFAVQLAKAAGAHVAVICGPRSVEQALMLGADEVIDYTSQDVAAGTRRFDAIIDVFGRTPLGRLRRVLRRRGRLVIVGGEGDRWTGGLQRQLWATFLSLFVSQRLRFFVVKENASTLLKANELIAAGRLAPSLGRTYSLRDAAEAVRDIETGGTAGRVALVCDVPRD
jgi:NADPH:quinone reductase-like Zn-dependent oxidoreductase